MSMDFAKLLLYYEIPSSYSTEIKDYEKKRYQLESHEDYEIVLMLWGVGHQTPIHDHHKSHCWTRLIQGELCERIFDTDRNLKQETNLLVNEINYIENHIGIHQILNETNRPAISLHLYSHPLKTFHLYDESSKRWIQENNTYDHFLESSK